MKDWQPLDAESITTCQSDSSVNLVPDDIVVHNLKIDFAMKEKNPVDHVSFFSDFKSAESFKIPKEKVEYLTHKNTHTRTGLERERRRGREREREREREIKQG